MSTNIFYFIKLLLLLIKEAYEKQLQELEDENEKCHCELSKIEKQLEKLKIENIDLTKTKVK
jgi:hypothetical protein